MNYSEIRQRYHDIHFRPKGESVLASALGRVISFIFPGKGTMKFHPIDDMRSILGYQYRLSRTEGVDLTGFTTAGRLTPTYRATGVTFATEGRYVEVGKARVGDLFYPERSVKIAVFEAPEPTEAQITVEELEKCLG